MDSEQVTHRRRQRNAWQKTPAWVKISLAICLILLAASLATGNRVIDWARNRTRSNSASSVQIPQAKKSPPVDAGKSFDELTSKLPSFDLELSGTDLNLATRRIEGTVVNKSDRAYTEVRIKFAWASPDLMAQDSSVAVIPKLSAHGRASFASDVLPQGARQWAVVNVTGTPAPPEKKKADTDVASP
jgi:hypothetical protein